MSKTFEYQVIDEKRDVKVLFFTYDQNEAIEYLVSTILNGIQTAQSLGLNVKNIDLSNFRVDIIEKRYFRSVKRESLRIDDYAIVSSTGTPVAHSAETVDILRTIKKTATIQMERTKNNVDKAPEKQTSQQSVSSLLQNALNSFGIKKPIEKLDNERKIPKIIDDPASKKDIDDSLPKRDDHISESESEEDTDITEDFAESEVSTIQLDEEFDNPEDLLDVVDLLEAQKNESKDRLTKIKKNLEFDQDNLCEFNYEASMIKHDIERIKDRSEMEKRVFESEKNFTYPKIKDDIVKGRSDPCDIPDMFIKKYPVYEYMDKNNLLDKDDAFEIYQSLYYEIHGDSEEEENNENNNIDDDYLKYKTEYYKYLDEESKIQKKNNKPLEDILNELDKQEAELDSKNEYFDTTNEDSDNSEEEFSEEEPDDLVANDYVDNMD